MQLHGFACDCDIAAFMHALGYYMTATRDASTAALFHTAVQVTSSLHPARSSSFVITLCAFACTECVMVMTS